MRALSIAAIIIFISTKSLAQHVEKFGPVDVDAGKETCHSLKGTDIIKRQDFKAPEDRFFKNIDVKEVSGWAPKKHVCELHDIQKKEITLHSDAGDVQVTVDVGFTVVAYADCGTSAVNFGKTISEDCAASADLVKYTNQ